MSIRSEKVASAIKRVLTANISNLAAEKGLGLASVSTIKLSKDFGVANVFVNLFTQGDKSDILVKQFLDLLNNNRGQLRSVVAREVQMRSTPSLRFFYDDTLEQMQKIDDLINNLKTNFPYKENYGDENVYKN